MSSSKPQVRKGADAIKCPDCQEMVPVKAIPLQVDVGRFDIARGQARRIPEHGDGCSGSGILMTNYGSVLDRHPAGATLNQVLGRLGYSTQVPVKASTNLRVAKVSVKFVVDADGVKHGPFTAHETWQWLRQRGDLTGRPC